MALFLIKRNVGQASQDMIDAAVVRAITCALGIEGMRWVTSYWDKTAGNTHCVYEARSAEDIREHAERAKIACDEILEVESIDPSQYWGPSKSMEPATP